MSSLIMTKFLLVNLHVLLFFKVINIYYIFLCIIIQQLFFVCYFYFNYFYHKLYRFMGLTWKLLLCLQLNRTMLSTYKTTKIISFQEGHREGYFFVNLVGFSHRGYKITNKGSFSLCTIT